MGMQGIVVILQQRAKVLHGGCTGADCGPFGWVINETQSHPVYWDAGKPRADIFSSGLNGAVDALVLGSHLHLVAVGPAQVAGLF